MSSNNPLASAETLALPSDKSELMPSGGELMDNCDAASTVSNSDSVVSVGKSAASDSTSGKASGIPKPSGIKPPTLSRIGRPCMGQQKPAVPATPAKNGSDDTLRRLTDDLGRHRLTDVQEENEDDFSSKPVNTTKRNRYSSIGSTASSMDYLWDLHPRRLSEAGLSRHSDNSTILTEDTDSFIIGQRVWVGGSKPGSIAYIGETQFAPGDWAGISLDQPIGKNDGSVGGIRYFQCEPKKGVFSRLTRLTRYPLTDPEMGSGDTYVCSTPLNGTRRSPISPTGSTSLIRSTQSLNTSNTSLASTHVDFKIGDRVIIKSSQGSKIGTLRYIGTTDFAAGEWCGVELDDPRGKNDGSVEGKRYFECRPNFGLFAPITKVSKSPSSRRPGGCVIHSGPGIPPSGFKRTGSKESLTSNASITSAASGVRRVRLGITSLATPQKVSPKTSAAPLPTRTALQEVLKEKQQHIEQLLKERDLECAEIARAACQADEAEQKYVTLRQEYEQYRVDCERALKEHRDLLFRLKEEREEFATNLDDEKRKNEDLQFRFEEAAIIKADIEVANDANLVRIKELEEALVLERTKKEQFEADANRIFEMEDALMRAREENEILLYEIEVAKKKIVHVESESLASKDSANSLQTELSDLHDLLRQKDEALEKLKIDVEKLVEDHDVAGKLLAKELDDYRNKAQADEAEIAAQKSTLELLRTELLETKNALADKTMALEKLTTTNAEAQEKLNKEINKLKMELSARNLDLENSADANRKKQEEIKNLKFQLETVADKFASQDAQKESLKIAEGNLKKELEDARATIKAKIIEVEESKKDFVVTLEQKESELKQAKKELQQHLKEIDRLNEDLTEAKEIGAKNCQNIRDEFERKLRSSEEQLVQANAHLKSKSEELEKDAESMRSKLENDVASKNEALAKLRGELDAAKKRIEAEVEFGGKLNEELTRLKLDFGDVQRKLATAEAKVVELAEQKAKLEAEVESLLGSSGDFSSKLEEVTRELRDREKAVEMVRNELTGKLQEAERNKQEVELKLAGNFEKAEKEKADLQQQIKIFVEEKDALNIQHQELLEQKSSTIEDLTSKIKNLQNDVEAKENALKKLKQENEEREAILKADQIKTSEVLHANLEETQKKINELAKENMEIKEALSKKNVEILEAESKHNLLVEQAKQTESELRTALEDQLRQNELDRKEFDNLLNSQQKQLKNQLQDSESSGQEAEAKFAKTLLEKTQLEDLLAEKNLQQERIAEDMATLQTKLQEQERQLREKDEAIARSQGETSDLKQQLSTTGDQLQTVLLEKQNKIDDLSKENEVIKQQTLKLEELLANTQRSEKSYEEQLAKLQNDVLTETKATEASKSAKEEEIKQLKGELQINHQFVEKLRAENKELQRAQADLNKLQEERAKQCTELTEKLNEVRAEADETSRKLYALDSAGNLYVTLLQLVQLTEKQKVSLMELLKESGDEEEKAKLFKLVEGIRVVNERDEEQERRLAEMREEVELLRKLVQESDDTAKLQEAENLRLKNELEKASEALKTKTTSAVSKIPTKVDNVGKVVNNNNVVTNEQLLEEKLLAENQVAFLNSIIVDIQKKNEEQKMRIELLESGYSPAAVEELNLMGLTERKKLPPRMYCDICEEFDLHETEDCPQQATEDLPARDQGSKEKPAERPYCELCEVFGHNTEDCNEDQTF